MSRDPTGILNWRRVDARITLSGQPTSAQFHTLRDMGVEHVINLGPHDSPKALAGQSELLAGLGLGYTYIPVDFSAPTSTDYNRFCQALDDGGGAAVHIHCIYNARVTAFMLRRAAEGRGGSLAQAQEIMDGIWRPGGVWAMFLGNAEDQSKPDRYAGYDY